MLKGLAIVGAAVALIAAIVLVARFDKNYDTASHGYDAQCAEPSQPSSAAASLVCTVRPVQDAKQGESGPPWWHILLTWPEGITAWAVILTLFAIAWQSAETARAAKAARMAVEHSIASERAWILPELVWLGSGAKDAPEGSDQVFILCDIKNHGKTPARVFGMNARWEIGPISEPAKTWNDSLYVFDAKAKPKWVVLPDKHTALSVPIPGFTATAKSKVPIPTQPNETMFIHGVIRYWDMFCEADRFTRFCYRWESAKENPAMGDGYHQAGGGTFNQQT